MALEQRDIHLTESLLNRIHHHARPADEVLMLGEGRWQIALEYLSGDEPLLARPVGRRICQYEDDRQIEPRFDVSNSSRNVSQLLSWLVAEVPPSAAERPDRAHDSAPNPVVR